MTSSTDSSGDSLLICTSSHSRCSTVCFAILSFPESWRNTSLDCVTAVVCDFLSSFVSGESSFPLALDLKGAFNAVLSAELFTQLRDLRLPGKLINFISFLTARRNLFFSSTDSNPRVSRVGVPQGGVLSPILFNLHLRLLTEFLPPDVHAAMYADEGG